MGGLSHIAIKAGFCLALLLTPCQIAQAQSTPDKTIGDILEDILGGQVKLPDQTPVYGAVTARSLPVTLEFSDQISTDSNFENMTLELLSRTPSPDGSDKRKTLSSLKLDMTGALPARTQIGLTVPAQWEDSYPFLVFDAVIRDPNGMIKYQAERLATYRGDSPPTLILAPLNLEPSLPPRLDVIGFEDVKGQIDIERIGELPQGSEVIIQLVENALAGGNSIEIAAEHALPVPRKNPVEFSFQRSVYQRDNAPDLGFKIWVKDWAGRKIRVMRQAVGYNGPDIDYEFRLDRLAQGADTKVGRTLNPTLMAQALVHGNVVYDPVAGIPGGARVRVKLIRSVGNYAGDPLIAQQVFILPGLATQMPFSISAASTYFDPNIPAPYLLVELVDQNDRIYYSSGQIRAREDEMIVRLFPQ